MTRPSSERSGRVDGVSVIVPCLNEASHIESLLKSLAGQQCPGLLFEVIVVDNGSVDGTPEYAAQLGARVFSEPRKSSYRARNLGIRNARYSWLAFLDGDCIPDAHWLVELLAAADESQSKLVAGRIEYGSKSPTLANHLHAYRKNADDCRSLVEDHHCVPGGNMLIHRSLFISYGCFRPVVSGGDIAFSQTAAANGETIAYAYDAVVRHDSNYTNGSFLTRAYRIRCGQAVNQGHRYGILSLLTEIPWRPGIRAVGPIAAALDCDKWHERFFLWIYLWLERVSGYLGMASGMLIGQAKSRTEPAPSLDGPLATPDSFGISHPGLVSVIIPVYNRAGMLREAVDSVIAQTYRPVEVVISDDGSDDDTPCVVEELCDTYPDVVRSVRNPNRGAGPAREAGRLMARGEYIQYLDSDDYLHPNKFADQVKSLEENPDCGIAYGITRLTDMKGNVLDDPFKWTGQERSALFPGLLVDRWWCTHTPLYRRSLCDMLGAWTDLKYSQDWEYDTRAGAAGVKLVSCNTLVSDHRTHEEARQTGHGRWLDPQARVRFFSLMLAHAQRGGVPPDCPEMAHFARWVFSHCRQCGAMGDATASRDCWRIASRAMQRPVADMTCYRRLAAIMGWHLLGRLTCLLDRIRDRRHGAETLALSWMPTESGVREDVTDG